MLRIAERLPLADIDPEAVSRGAGAVKLGEIYTAPLTLGHDIGEVAVRAADRSVRVSRLLSTVEQLQRYDRLVLLGEVGSGKTTFLNFIAMCFAAEGLDIKHRRVNLGALASPVRRDDDLHGAPRPPTAQSWPHGALLPVPVSLRDFAARGLPAPGERASARHLWNYLVSTLDEATLGDFAAELQRVLMENGAMVLLDGLDEVPDVDRRRMQVKEAIEDFVDTYGHRCRFLVTSRTYAYEQRDRKLASFAEATLAPFGSAQTAPFIERWYVSISAIRAMSQDDAKRRADLLNKAIGDSDSLQALAERPLLLTLMVSLSASCDGPLYDQRGKVYAEALELLLARWQSAKDASIKTAMQLPSRAEWVDRHGLRSLLEQVAYEAHAARPDSAEVDVLSRLSLRLMQRRRRNRDVDPTSVVDYLIERTGLILLRSTPPDVYEFLHSTFQEYLAACHLARLADPADLARRALDDPVRWREVVLLTATKTATPYLVCSLVDELCNGEPVGTEEVGDLLGAQVAGQVIVESAEAAKLKLLMKARPEQVERVARWLMRVVREKALPEIERNRARLALVRMRWPGDDRIRELMHEAEETHDTELVAICLHALKGDDGAREKCVRVIMDAEA